uniref:CBM21 domain-containing protein n=1 Tax=Myripristis murdjan TaxID=586833 RepID=A0A668A0T8_9TELE
MHLCLSQGQPLYQLLAMKPRKPISRSTDYTPKRSPDSPPHSLSSSSSPSSSPGFSQPRSCIRKKSGKWQNKKHVMFADAKGLALTTLHLFIPEPSPPPATMVLNPTQPKVQCQQSPSMKTQRYKLRLGFPQPTLDTKAFLARLQETQIQLESCSVSEYSLSGKVCICSTSIENTVYLRMTYDSWRNYHDIPCTFLQQHYRGLNMDVFAFDVALPHNLKPNDRVEFCVFFRPSAIVTLSTAPCGCVKCPCDMLQSY